MHQPDTHPLNVATDQFVVCFVFTEIFSSKTLSISSLDKVAKRFDSRAVS